MSSKLARKMYATLCAIVLAASGIALTPTPASAVVTTLCTGYAGCAKAGMGDGGYSKVSGKMYWRMYSGHNCTNYAAYRMIKAGMPNTRPWSGSGNATYWGTSMRSITNSTPRVGSVAWWKAGVHPAGSAGHVAYVERVVSSSEIIVSQDSWGGNFSWARVTRTTKGWPSGFIHFRDSVITNTAAPKITGVAKVGSRLTAAAGTWSVSGATYAYHWLANGASITGATASTLTLTNALKAKRISVRVTATRLGYPTSAATSAATAAVQPGVLTNSSAPTISGDPRVDSTLTAQPGSWDPGPGSVSYQWQADGTNLPAATTRTLEVEPAMIGKKLRVRVTAARTGYTAVKAFSAATAPVAPGVMPPMATPDLAGQVVPGGTLRLGAVALDRGTTRTVSWKRNHTRIPGATGSTYKVSAADLGHRIRAVVYLNRPGYTQMRLGTPWTKVVRTRPVMRVSATPGHRRLAFRATVRAAGVRDFNGVIRVRSRGKLIREVPVRHGVASATLTRLRPGARTYRFRLPLTTTTEHGVVVRRLKIR